MFNSIIIFIEGCTRLIEYDLTTPNMSRRSNTILIKFVYVFKRIGNKNKYKIEKDTKFTY